MYSLTTLFDLFNWMSAPNDCSIEQVSRLKDEDQRLELIKLVNEHWLLGEFYYQLHRSKHWDELDLPLKEYLTELNQVYLDRAMNIKKEVEHLSKLLKDKEILLLKGAAHLFNGVAEPISRRFMSDIDILINEPTLDISFYTLLKNDYSLAKHSLFSDINQFHHAPPLIKTDSNIHVELHRQPLKLGLKCILDVNDAWCSKVCFDSFAFKNVNQLSATNTFIHSIAHSQIADRGYEKRELSLRQLVNAKLIIDKFQTDIEWEFVAEVFKKNGVYHIFNSYCFLLKELLSVDIPLYIEKDYDFLWNCLSKLTSKEQRKYSSSHFNNLLSTYSDEGLILIYGDKGKISIIFNRFRWLFRHFRMFFNFSNLRDFLRRCFK